MMGNVLGGPCCSPLTQSIHATDLDFLRGRGGTCKGVETKRGGDREGQEEGEEREEETKRPTRNT